MHILFKHISFEISLLTTCRAIKYNKNFTPAHGMRTAQESRGAAAY
jgi:hypothetical protein